MKRGQTSNFKGMGDSDENFCARTTPLMMATNCGKPEVVQLLLHAAGVMPLLFGGDLYWNAQLFGCRRN